MRVLITALLLLFTPLALGQGLGQPGTPTFTATPVQDFLPVEEAYQLEVEVLDDGRLRLYWQIADSYYLYQHAFKFKANNGTQTLTPQFPPALERTDEYFGDVSVYYQQADIPLTASPPLSEGSVLAVTFQGCADAGLCYPPRTQYFTLDLASAGAREIERPGSKTPTASRKAGAANADLGSLPYMLLLAFLGGTILNLMPCVFPILSLKVLSFARSSDHDRHLQSWVYTAGVVVSFVAVAAVLIGLQQAGKAVGWGFQLQSPGFVVALAYLFLAMALSLSGLVHLGGSLMNAGSGLANRSGPAGSFFTGVLAVVVASPCTAPFMGTALGFAVTQPPLVGLSVFAALGLGMAAPLLLFSYSGAARALMPRPGPWMETLKQFLAFPLYAAAIWLLWVAGRQTGVNTMAAVLAGALALAMALWLWSLGGWKRGLAVACALLAISLGSWRGLDENGSHASTLADSHVAWSEQRLADLRKAGNPVFVDVTADWCITCIANERAVLLTDSMQAAFAEHGVVYMVADWTNYDADIAEFISRHGRTGIPLYLMYSANTASGPLILPQILTADTVLEALESVSVKKKGIAAIVPTNQGHL
ncbi:protein-disulfide reductase DsbD family protein [Pseudohalioglobus lutimaris]|uniref:Disulfide bond formation protein DsbD n=1 Tax=Pseudohalioglobus lutimaris TaxID=1737061 RepID=A0A2N5X1A2_9GAMM|nr:protein-disulfide reductase DsbD [Pseudohalioglobus lutimaris]PLW68230.1 disulfide bond formation protein DsbD [Pseudohalioglobus lutimaris]